MTYTSTSEMKHELHMGLNGGGTIYWRSYDTEESVYDAIRDMEMTNGGLLEYFKVECWVVEFDKHTSRIDTEVKFV